MSSTADSAATKSIIDGVSKLFDTALQTSPTSGNGFGLALGLCLGVAAICGIVLWVFLKRYDKLRDKIDTERKSDIEALNAERKQDKIDRERESAERLAADERLKREFALADQQNREAGRASLTSHLDTRFEKVIDHIDTSVEKLEAEVDAGKNSHATLDRDFVLLKQSFENLVKTVEAQAVEIRKLSDEVVVLKSKK